MEVQHQDEGRDSTRNKVTALEDSARVRTAQPQAAGKPQDITGEKAAHLLLKNHAIMSRLFACSTEMLCADLDLGDSSESLTDAVVTGDDALLLPDHIPTISQRIEKGYHISKMLKYDLRLCDEY